MARRRGHYWGFLGGVLFAVVVALLVSYLIVRAGALPANADAIPSPNRPRAARASVA
jgi:CDP-diglyceride synthetase